MLLMSNEASVTIHKYKYNSQIQTQVADICEAYQLSQCHHNWRLTIYPTTHSTSQHNCGLQSLQQAWHPNTFISSTYCQRQPAQVIRYFPAAAFTTILASQTTAATWSPSLEFHHSSYHWVGLTKRDEKSMWHDAQCTNFWRICLGSQRFWFEKLQKLFYRFSLSISDFFQYIFSNTFVSVLFKFPLKYTHCDSHKPGVEASSPPTWFDSLEFHHCFSSSTHPCDEILPFTKILKYVKQAGNTL